MGVAALGYLPPLAGALFQKAVDLAVILNRTAGAARVTPRDQPTQIQRTTLGPDPPFVRRQPARSWGRLSEMSA